MDRYAEMMDKLKRPQDWDVPGLIADITLKLQEQGDTESMAVIDTLLFLLRKIHDDLGEGHPVYHLTDHLFRLPDQVRPSRPVSG